MESYYFIIGASLIVVFSYLINIISDKTNIPSVLMLIVLGVLIKEGLLLAGIEFSSVQQYLAVLGTVGLILIVLEAALDLELRKDRIGIIFRSFFSALIGVAGTAYLLALILQTFIDIDLFRALLFAVPISILSSAIIIPSVKSLPEEKKEFLIYESTFSDILGLMFFYFLLSSVEMNSLSEMGMSVGLNVVVTIILSFVITYFLIIIFQNIKTEVKLFLLIAVLVLMYAIGKIFHISSLLMILIFGLVINNSKIFFKGFLRKYLKYDDLQNILHHFKIITLESAFVVRTFFFIIFGISISLMSLVNFKVWIISIVVLAGIYLIRYLLMLVFVGKHSLTETFIAPRGLISILLFFAIPQEYLVKDFDDGILLFVIIVSGVLMTWSLIKYKKNEEIEADLAKIEEEHCETNSGNTDSTDSTVIE